MIEHVIFFGSSPAFAVRDIGGPIPNSYVVKLHGEGAELGMMYANTRFGRGYDETIRLALADWCDEHADELKLPDHLRPLIGQAVRDGCPDAATTTTRPTT